jgi:hypothetical protein
MIQFYHQTNIRLAKAAFLCFSFLLLATSFVSCNREATEIPAPIAALISAQTSCVCEPYIEQYRWKGKIVYISSCRGPACQCLVIFYNANGEAFQPGAGYSFDQFRQEAWFVRLVWRCGE